MRWRNFPAFAGVSLLPCVGLTAAAQTTINPDISVIGDIRGMTADRPEDVGLEQKQVFELHEVELAVQGYLNPYARGDVFFAWHDDHAEVEEASITFERGLPWGLSARAGRYLGNFGRLNLLHPHAYSFIDRPLVLAEYLGDHGFADDGVSVRWLMPITAVYVELSADLLRGAAFVGHHHAGATEADIPPDKGFLSHLSIAGATGEYSETAGGISLAYGHYDPTENLVTTLVGADLKHKYKPSRYTSLTLQAEALLNRRETGDEHHHEEEAGEEEQHDEVLEEDFTHFFGAYAFVDYQFQQRYNLGIKVDYFQPLEDKNNEVTQVQAFCGFAPVEETSLLRLAGYYRKPADGEGVFGATLQLVFSLGPHRPHSF
jgi:hypothetical protein